MSKHSSSELLTACVLHLHLPLRRVSMSLPSPARPLSPLLVCASSVTEGGRQRSFSRGCGKSPPRLFFQEHCCDLLHPSSSSRPTSEHSQQVAVTSARLHMSVRGVGAPGVPPRVSVLRAAVSSCSHTSACPLGSLFPSSSLLPSSPCLLHPSHPPTARITLEFTLRG